MIRIAHLLLFLVLLTVSVAVAVSSPTTIRAIVVSEDEPDNLTILDRRGDRWLVEGTSAQLSAWPDATPVPSIPIRPHAAVRTWTPIKRVDPLVQDLVDQVMWDDLLDDVEWIVDLGVRYSLNAHIDVVADSLVARFEALGLPTEKRPFRLNDDTRYNVITTQTGTVHPDSIFVVCGHYDAVSENPNTSTPGADDNASGTCAVLTCARLFAPFESAYTIQYVLFAGEEQGLYGSGAWVGAMATAGANIIGAMNVDMVGWCGRFAPFDLEVETNAHSRWMADAIVDAAELYTDMPYILHQDESAWWGDFHSFWQHGYCAVNHEEAWDWGDPDFNPYYHSVLDLPDRLNPDFMTGNVKVVVAGLATLAQMNDPQVAVPEDAIRGVHALASVSPNPFNPRTTVAYDLAAAGRVRIAIYDATGARVRTLFDGEDGPGSHEEIWDGRDQDGRRVPSGSYFVRLEAGGAADTRKVALIK